MSTPERQQDGQFHGQCRKERRLDAPVAQPGPDLEIRPIVRQLKARGRLIPRIHRVMAGGAHHQIQRDELGGIEQMVETQR